MSIDSKTVMFKSDLGEKRFLMLQSSIQGLANTFDTKKIITLLGKFENDFNKDDLIKELAGTLRKTSLGFGHPSKGFNQSFNESVVKHVADTIIELFK